jgi:hypothetical protein
MQKIKKKESNLTNHIESDEMSFSMTIYCQMLFSTLSLQKFCSMYLDQTLIGRYSLDISNTNTHQNAFSFISRCALNIARDTSQAFQQTDMITFYHDVILSAGDDVGGIDVSVTHRYNKLFSSFVDKEKTFVLIHRTDIMQYATIQDRTVYKSLNV